MGVGLAGRLAGWLAGWWAGWLADWLPGWRVGGQAGIGNPLLITANLLVWTSNFLCILHITLNILVNKFCFYNFLSTKILISKCR